MADLGNMHMSINDFSLDRLSDTEGIHDEVQS